MFRRPLKTTPASAPRGRRIVEEIEDIEEEDPPVEGEEAKKEGEQEEGVEEEVRH